MVAADASFLRHPGNHTGFHGVDLDHIGLHRQYLPELIFFKPDQVLVFLPVFLQFLADGLVDGLGGQIPGPGLAPLPDLGAQLKIHEQKSQGRKSAQSQQGRQTGIALVLHIKKDLTPGASSPLAHFLASP